MGDSTANTRSFDTGDPDFVLEEINIERHLLDFHTLWTDPTVLKYVPRKAPRSLSETRSFMPRYTRGAHPGVHNYAIVLRPESTSNPTNPASPLYPPPDTASYPEEPPEEPPSAPSVAPTASPAPPRDPTATPRPYLAGVVGIVRPAPTRGDPRPLNAESVHNVGPEVGYMVAAQFWGRGLASRGLAAFAQVWHAHLAPAEPVEPAVPEGATEEEVQTLAKKAACLEAQIDSANVGSAKVAARAGFVRDESEPVIEYTLTSTGEKATRAVWRLANPNLKQ